jgi:hypothetical protein
LDSPENEIPVNENRNLVIGIEIPELRCPVLALRQVDVLNFEFRA